MKKVYLLLFLGLTITLVTCRKGTIIYANHYVTACGVNDPLVNLPWLAEWIDEAKKEKHLKEMSIKLLLDTITQENAFKILYYFKQGRKENYLGYGCDCLGKIQYKFWYMNKGIEGIPPNPDDEEKFYKDKKDLGVIWSIKQ